MTKQDEDDIFFGHWSLVIGHWSFLRGREKGGRRMARTEYQLKVEGRVEPSLLLCLGAEPLGQGTQQDVYLAGEGTRRIRAQAGQYLYTEKAGDIGSSARVREVTERPLSKKEADHLMRQAGVRVLVCKTRTLFRLHGVVIALDEVEHLGDFVELRSASEEELFRVLKLLGLTGPALRETYLELMVRKNLPRWLRALSRFHDKVGELAFGITSGILTTVGVLIGVNSASGDRLAVIASVVAIAVADSWSDAFGMYTARVTERGSSRAAALRYAAGTLLGKLVMPLTFLLPIALLPLGVAVIVDLVWGAVVLALLSLERALVGQLSPVRQVAVTLGLAALIVTLSSLAGSLVRQLVGPP
jgi:adenylate cyclase class IV